MPTCPDAVSLTPDYAAFRPTGAGDFAYWLERLTAILAWSVETGVQRLLVDATRISGLTSLSTFDRFQLGEQPQQLLAEDVQRSGHSAGELGQGDAEVGGIVRVDDPEHGLRLRQIELAGEKRPQRELAWPGGPRSIPEELGNQCFDERRAR